MACNGTGWHSRTQHRGPERHGHTMWGRPHLRLLLIPHEELLLADPRLGLAGIHVVLLGLAGLLQPPLPRSHLLPQSLPLHPQLLRTLRQLRARSFGCRLAACQHLGQPGGMALQLLLQGLPRGQGVRTGGGGTRHPQVGRWVPPWHGLTSFLLARRCTLCRSVPWSVDLARGILSCTHSCRRQHPLSALCPLAPQPLLPPPLRCSPSHPPGHAPAGTWPWRSPAPSSSSPVAPAARGSAAGASAPAHQAPAQPRRAGPPAPPAPPAALPLAPPAAGGGEPSGPNHTAHNTLLGCSPTARPLLTVSLLSIRLALVRSSARSAARSSPSACPSQRSRSP